MSFDIPTPDLGEFGRENGYLQLGLTASQTATLGLTSALGYEIIAQEFLANPVGYSTFVGIQTGLWRTASGIVTDVTSTVSSGAAQTDYHVQFENINQIHAFAVGDVVKLVNHQVSPSLASVELTVAEKVTVNAATHRLRLASPRVYNSATNTFVNGWNLSGAGTTSNCINGAATADDYISIRDRFTIAKGRVGVI